MWLRFAIPVKLWWKPLIIMSRTRFRLNLHSIVAWMSRNSLLVWPVWLNGLVFVYDLSGCGFESLCCHFNMTLKGFGSNFCFIMNNVKVVGKELLKQYVNIPFKTRSYQYIPAYRQNKEIYGQLKSIQNPVKHRKWIFHSTKNEVFH